MSLLVLALALASPTQSKASHALTAAELHKTLPGTFIEEVFPYELRYMAHPEQFNEDGTYIRYADNLDLEGRYTIEGSTFCVSVEGREKLCRYLFVDPLGRSWVSKTTNPTDFRLVTIEPLRK